MSALFGAVVQQGDTVPDIDQAMQQTLVETGISARLRM